MSRYRIDLPPEWRSPEDFTANLVLNDLAYLLTLKSAGRRNPMTINIRRVLIEALKARETSLVELSQAICSANGVEECDMVVTDVDAKLRQ
jgi:hypothetical protein